LEGGRAGRGGQDGVFKTTIETAHGRLARAFETILWDRAQGHADYGMRDAAPARSDATTGESGAAFR